MTPQIEHNGRELAEAFRQYAAVSTRTPGETIVRQGANLARFLRKRLRTLAPEKGAIRAEREAALKAGEGLTIRKSVRDYANKNTMSVASDLKTRRSIMFMEMGRTGKLKTRNARTWWQLAAQREINMRERGRGFVAYSAAFTKLGKMPIVRGQQRQQVIDRYRRFLSSVGVRIGAGDASALFSWGGNKSSGEVAQVLNQSRGQDAIAGALLDTRNDMLTYVRRKLAENAAKTVGRVR